MRVRQEEMLNNLLRGETSQLIVKLGDSIVGRFPDKPLGDDIDCSQKTKDACNAWFLVSVRDVVEREVLEAIEEMNPSQNSINLELDLKKKINSTWNNILGFIYEKITQASLEEKTLDPVAQQRTLEHKLKQIIQIGEIALLPYLYKEKTGVENVSKDMQVMYETLLAAPPLDPREKSQILKICLDELAMLDPRSEPLKMLRATDPEYILQLRKIIYDLTVQAVKILANDTVLSAPLFERQLVNEMRKLVRMNELVLDINSIRLNLDADMPSSESDAFFRFTGENTHAKAIIHWLENRLRMSYNINTDTEEKMLSGRESAATHFMQCQSLLSALVGAKQEEDAHFKSSFYLFKRCFGVNDRLSHLINDVIKQYPEFKSLSVHSPRRDPEWNKIVGRIANKNAAKENEAKTGDKKTGKHRRIKTTRIEIMPRTLRRGASSRKIVPLNEPPDKQPPATAETKHPSPKR